MNHKPTSHLAVVGGGAAGLVAALVASLEAAKRGLTLHVTVFERMSECGRKLRATGNGRGNLGAQDMSAGHYVTTGAKALLDAIIARCDQQAVLELFQTIGLPLVAEDLRLYPLSLQAAQVREALVLACSANGVDIQTGTELVSVTPRASDYLLTLRRETTSERQSLSADFVIFAMGGSTQPALGANGNWQDWLARAGIQISELQPALQALDVIKPYRSLKGQRQPAQAQLWRRSRNQAYVPVAADRGEVQFTATGLSGVVIMQLSLFTQSVPVQGGTMLRVMNEMQGLNPPGPHIIQTLYGQAGAHAEYIVTLDVLPNWTSDHLAHELKRRTMETPWLKDEQFMLGLLPDKLAKVVLQMHAKLMPERNQNLETLVKLIKHMPFPLAQEQNSANAQVSLGGIQLDELRPHSFELRQLPGVYACGEMLDVAGLCGGYNLAFAFTSARAAAREIIASLDGV